jgi:sulfate adenylyltransferase subunit 2
MNHLDRLESKSIYIIREAYAQCRKLAMLWSVGKDSTTLLWLVRKAFFGRIPFPVVQIDTGFQYPEVYEFRDRMVERFGFEFIVGRNEEAIEKVRRGEKLGPDAKLACCTALKTHALQEVLAEHGFNGLLLGIRRDEHGIRAKERVFSPRDEDFKWNYKQQTPEFWDQYRTRSAEGSHMRIHPILHWREIDIWRYIQRENLPSVPLYFAKDGKRFRSIGCETCCNPVDSDADTIEKILVEIEGSKTGERAGRAQDKEDAYTMQKLRALGYM